MDLDAARETKQRIAELMDDPEVQSVLERLESRDQPMTQYHARVSARVRDHVSSLMRGWVNDGRNDDRIERIVRSLVLFAYTEGLDDGAAQEFATLDAQAFRKDWHDDDKPNDAEFFERLHDESMRAYIEERDKRRKFEDAALSTDDLNLIGEVYDAGLVWLVNAAILHPRGYALAVLVDEEEDRIIGLKFVGDGKEPWCFGEGEADVAYENFVKSEQKREAAWTPLVNPPERLPGQVAYACEACDVLVYDASDDLTRNVVDNRPHTCFEEEHTGCGSPDCCGACQS